MILQLIIQHAFEVVLSGVVLALTYSLNRMKCKVMKTTSEFQALKIGQQALLRAQIIHAYNKYVVDLKWIPIYEVDNINKLFKAYEGLDGNGTIPDLVEELKSLQKYQPAEEEKHDETIVT